MQLRVRPAFITLLGCWLALSCNVGLVLPGWLLVGHADSHSINGTPATLTPLLPGLASLAIFSGVTSWAILTERPLGRPLAIILIMLLVAGPGLSPASGSLPFSAVWPFELAITLVVGLPLLWYLYRKKNVVEYYRELKRASSAARPKQG